ATATSAGDGSFELAVPPDTKALVVTHPEFVNWSDRIPSPEADGIASTDVFLERGGQVIGTVRDSAGEPLAGARLSLSFDPLSEKRSARSASDGSYALQGLPAGSYTVDMSLAGEERTGSQEQVHVTLTDGEVVRVDFGKGARPGARLFGII